MTRPARRARAASLTTTLVVFGLALASGPGSAQELTGVALGPDGGPLVDVPVVLHRVGGGSAAFIATDTTGSDGGFGFALPAADSAIYFAAVRYEDRLYIGPAVPADGAPVRGYVLSVGPGSEAGAVASALSGRTPMASTGPTPGTAPGAAPGAGPGGAGGSDTGAFVLLALLTLGAVTAFLFAAPRYRHRRTREALIELASVENALAESHPAGDRARLRETRDRLRKQLAPRS